MTFKMERGCPMRLRPCALCLILLLTGVCRAPAQTYEGYDAGISQTVERMVAALERRPDASVVVPPLRRSDGTMSELGALLAQDLLIALSGTLPNVSACHRSGFADIFEEVELERQGLIEPDGVHELGRFCSADVLLHGSVFPEGEGVTLRLQLVDTETAETLTGDRFWVPLSRAEQDALANAVPPDPPPAASSTSSRSDHGVPQHDRVGDFTLTLTRCIFIRHDGLFCHLEARNDQVVDSTLTVLGTSSLLVDNQGERYHPQALIESESAEPISFEISPKAELVVPAGMMLSIKLHFRVSRREQKAQGLVIYTPAGPARFGSFYFDRDSP